MDQSRYYDPWSSVSSALLGNEKKALTSPPPLMNTIMDDEYDAKLAQKLSGQNQQQQQQQHNSATTTRGINGDQEYTRTTSSMASILLGRDWIWAWLYVGTTLTFLATSLLPILFEGYNTDSKLYHRFIQVIVPELKAIILISMIIGVGWSWCMSLFAAPIIYGMLLFMPLVLTLAAIIISLTGNPGSWIVAFILIMASIGLYKLIRLNGDSIDSTVQIVRCAATVLRRHPTVYISTVSLTLLYIVLVFMWLILFSHLFFHEVANGGGSLYPKILAVVVLAWTGSIIGNYQRALIAKIVNNWYFHNHGPHSGNEAINNNKAILFQPRKYMGQFALAGLVLTIADGVRFLNWTMKKLLDRIFPPNSIMRPIVNLVMVAMNGIESGLNRFTTFSVMQVVFMEGNHSLLECGRQVWMILRRNLLLSAINDLTTSLVFTVTGGCTALCTGLLWQVFDQKNGESEKYDWIVPVVVSLITFVVLRFFTNVYTSAMDASFLCYSLDLDQSKGQQVQTNDNNNNNNLNTNSQYGFNINYNTDRHPHQQQPDLDRLALYQAFAIKLSQLPK